MRTEGPIPIHILYAEDDEDDSMFFREAIEQSKLKVLLTIVNNGEKVIDFLTKNDGWAHIIFLDVNMPRMNGEECLIQLKNDFRFKHIPVVMLSTSHYEKNKLIDIGAIHFICKTDFNQNPVKMLTYVLNKQYGVAL